MKTIARAFAVAASILAPGSAHAAPSWFFSIDEDPLTDAKTATALFNRGDVAIAIKCWAGKPDETMLVYASSEGQASINDAPRPATLTIRVDKRAPRDVKALTSEFLGRPAYKTAFSMDFALRGSLAELRTAKDRLVIGDGVRAEIISIKGVTSALDRLWDVCKF